MFLGYSVPEKSPTDAKPASPKSVIEGELAMLIKQHEAESLRLLKLEDSVKHQSIKVGYVEGQIAMAKRVLAVNMEVKE